jgi:two-component system, chemotaxis family, chemotaxis protein CheY
MLTILVVEDSAMLLKMVSTAIGRGGFHVIEARGPREALEILDGRPIDMVITDLIMPDLDGIELTRMVRSLDAYKRIPILMLTTQSSAALKQEGRTAGVNGWVVKPFLPTDLITLVRKLLAP